METTSRISTSTTDRIALAAGWGAVATLAMTALMLVGVTTGASPIPKPIPAALVEHTVGPLSRQSMIVLGLLAHVSYGAVAGGVFAAVASRVTVARGLALGTVLWALMGLTWLPYLGWGLFGLDQSAGVAGATLLLHLVYGATYGWLMGRRSTAV